jgi:hypothetical protein
MTGLGFWRRRRSAASGGGLSPLGRRCATLCRLHHERRRDEYRYDQEGEKRERPLSHDRRTIAHFP